MGIVLGWWSGMGIILGWYPRMGSARLVVWNGDNTRLISWNGDSARLVPWNEDQIWNISVLDACKIHFSFTLTSSNTILLTACASRSL